MKQTFNKYYLVENRHIGQILADGKHHLIKFLHSNPNDPRILEADNDAAKELIQILNNFYIESEDLTNDHLYIDAEWIKNPELKQIDPETVLKIFLYDDYSTDGIIGLIQRIGAFNTIEAIDETDLNYYTDIDDVKEFLTMIHNIPEELESFMDWDHLLQEQDIGGTMSEYKILEKDNSMSLGYVIIEYNAIEEFAAEIEDYI